MTLTKKLPDQLPNQSTTQHFPIRSAIPLRSDVLWRIEQGVVRTFTWHTEGTLIVLGYWRVGDVVGQPLSRLCPYEIECLTDVEISALPTNIWDQSLEAVFIHLQQVEELHCIFRTQSVLERLKRFLRWLAQKFGHKIEQGWLIDLQLTDQEISEAIGVSRISVMRLLLWLEQENQVIRDRGRFILLQNSDISWIY